VEHKDYVNRIDWARDTPFTECETSLKFAEFMRDYTFWNGCPITKRCDKIETIDKGAFMDADEARFKKGFDEYVDFARVKYPIQYSETSTNFKTDRQQILMKIKTMRRYGRVNFKTMNMSGENEEYNIVVKIGEEMRDIKKHIIKEKYGGADHIYNIAFFIDGQEDAVRKWESGFMGASFFCLASAETERPLKITAQSYQEGDRVIYIADNISGTGGAFKRVAMGIIKAVGSSTSWLRVEEVLTERLPKSVKVSWDTPYYKPNNPLKHMEVCICQDIINIQRWDGENPIYSDTKEWVNNEHLPTL